MVLFWSIPLGAAVILAGLLLWQVGSLFGLVPSWLLAINLVTFLTYVYDKAISGQTEKIRVPERVLLGLAFTGGSLGAYLGMQLARHKTAKRGFQIQYWLVVAVQLALFVGYLYFTNRAAFS